MVWQRFTRNHLTGGGLTRINFTIASAAFGETFTRIRFRIGLTAAEQFPFGSQGSVVGLGIYEAPDDTGPFGNPWTQPQSQDWMWWESIPFGVGAAIADSAGAAQFVWNRNAPAGDAERDVKAQRKADNPGSILIAALEIDDVTSAQNSFWFNWSSSTGILTAP